MSKQAVMMVVDAGHSMDEMYSQEKSRLRLALECVKMTLQQKVFTNTTHEVGFAIFGDVETDDGDDNSLLLQPLKKPDLELIRKVGQMSEARLDNPKPGGDIFKAIQYAITLLRKHCDKKKTVRKRIFLFTCGTGLTDYTEHFVRELGKEIQSLEIRLNVIPISFMQGYVLEENQVENQIVNPQQFYNAQLLMELKNHCQQHVQIFPQSLAIQLYRKFRRREVNPVALYRGEMEIAPGLAIQIQTYKAVRRERLKSLAKYDVNQPFNQYLQKVKEITTINSYIVQGDETNTEVEKEHQLNAYHYGPHLVPMSDILEKDTRLYEERNFRLLGFVDRNRIPRQSLMGEVEMAVPSKDKDNLPGRKLFTSLVYSMVTLGKYAVARYVARNSKGGVSPRLVALMPYRGPQKELLYVVDLPTVQDVRDYPFNSLKKATDKQRELVKEMVDKMQLFRRVDGEEKEEVPVEGCFNPARQYFFQAVFHRALHQEGDLPPLDPLIRRALTPQVKFFEETEPLMKPFKKEFKLLRKELSKEKLAKKQSVLWRDIIQNEMPAVQGSATSQSGEQLKPNKLFGPEEDGEGFDSANPLVSFNRMLNNNKVDLVDQALAQFTLYIQNKSKISLTEQSLSHIVQCASELRRGCDQQRQKEFWDDWLDKAKTSLGKKIYDKIIKEGLGYLNKSNADLFSFKQLHKLSVAVQEEIEDLD